MGVLRSVEKYPERAIPEVLRETFAQDLVQDPNTNKLNPYLKMDTFVNIHHLTSTLNKCDMLVHCNNYDALLQQPEIQRNL